MRINNIVMAALSIKIKILTFCNVMATQTYFMSKKIEMSIAACTVAIRRDFNYETIKIKTVFRIN